MFFSTTSGKSFDTKNVISTIPLQSSSEVNVILKGQSVPVRLTMEEYNDYVQFMKTK